MSSKAKLFPPESIKEITQCLQSYKEAQDQMHLAASDVRKQCDLLGYSFDDAVEDKVLQNHFNSVVHDHLIYRMMNDCKRLDAFRMDHRSVS